MYTYLIRPFFGKRETTVKAEDHVKALADFAISRKAIITDVDSNPNETWSFVMRKKGTTIEHIYVIKKGN
jgi:uncharacterized Rossmann fold enzyme